MQRIEGKIYIIMRGWKWINFTRKWINKWELGKNQIKH
jgi:hypothetical protein